MKSLFTVLSAFLLVASLSASAASPPLVLRTDPNLITPNCATAFSCTPLGWTMAGGAHLDCNAKHKVGCSMVITGNGDSATSGLIAVTPGQTYTFSFFAKTNSFPQAVPRIVAQLYRAGPVWDENTLTAYSVTRPNDWQEVILVFQPKAWQTGVVFLFNMDHQVADAGVATSGFWVSDLFLGRGISFDQPAVAKMPFAGSRVRVDELGNFNVYNTATGLFAPLFPMCIYADMNRSGWLTAGDTWSMYAAQGFNCNMWAGYPAAVQRGKDYHLYSGYDISSFNSPGDPNYNHPATLATNIASMKTSGLTDSLLFYYWDNENAELYEWATPSRIAQQIKTSDVDNAGARMHPIYQLQDTVGLHRKYNALRMPSGSVYLGMPALADVAGTYVHPDPLNYSVSNPMPVSTAKGWNLTIVNNAQNQNQPVTFAQFDSPDYAGHNFRAAVYTAIARGAKGFGYWKDCVVSAGDCTPVNGTAITPVDQNAWWGDLPALAANINSQVALIQTAPWASWLLNKTSLDSVEHGERNFAGRGYFIVANENAASASPTFTWAGLPYTPTHVIQAVTKDVVAVPVAGSFTLPLAANDGGFYLLGQSANDSMALGLQFAGNLADLSQAHNGHGVLVGTGAQAGISSVLNLNGGYAQIAATSATGSPGSLEMSNNLSIVAKVTLSASQSGYATIVSKGASTSAIAGYAFFYDPATSKLNFWYGAGSGDRNTMSVTVPNLLGTIHTVAVTATLAGIVTFYVDGAPYTGSGTTHAESANALLNTGTPLLIGSWAGGNYFHGTMSFVRLFKTALTTPELVSVSR